MLLTQCSTMIHIVVISLAWFVIEGRSLCPNATGCRCRSTSKWTVSAICQGLDPQLQFLPYNNVTKLVIQRGSLTNVSSLSILRQFVNLDRVTFRTMQLPSFDWNWLPDSCTKMSLIYSSYRAKSAFQYPPFNGTCNLRSSLNITRFSVTDIPYEQIPPCLPESLKTMSMNGVPLTALEENQTSREQPFIWPPKLQFLYIKSFSFNRFDSEILRNAPSSLNKIYASSCQKPFRRFPPVWPQTGALVYLYFRNCQINETQPLDFLYLQNLHFLDLSMNDLIELPKGLPASLKKLLLSKNSIKTVDDNAWDRLNNLTNLQLDNNKLQSIPRNLPQNLEVLNLRHNGIEFTERNIFSHLKRLTNLKLSNNKLLNMPEGLPTTMRKLDLQHNQIALVRSPRNYEYCANCLMLLNNNPWICNDNMIRLLLWESQHNVHLILQERCGNPIPDKDLGEVGTAFLIRYLDFMETHKTFRLCDYRIKSLKCVNASLSQFPPKAPDTLEYVEISNNPNLTMIPDGLFFNQSKLKTLISDSNSIKQFPKGLPASLELLQLNENQIESIPIEAGIFNNLRNLKTINLVKNRIKVIYDYQLTPLQSLSWIGLDGNPLICDCSLYPLTLWYQNLPLTAVHELFLPTCAGPKGYEGHKLGQILGAYRYDFECIPSLCQWVPGSGVLNCSASTQLKLENTLFIPEMADFTTLPHIPNNSYWLVLDLSHLRLQADDIKLNGLTQLLKLDLTDNMLSTLPLDGLPTSLEELILFRNKVERISPSIKQYVPRLKLLDLRQNNIKTIPSESLTAFPLVESVLLQDNPIRCDCDLRPLVSYIQAQERNTFTLNNNYFQTLMCQEPPRMKGSKLLRLEEEEYCKAIIWTGITGGVVGGVCFLLIIAIAINVILYKRKKVQERKDILLGFHKLLEKEALMNDEDTDSLVGIGGKSYQYDAFVSYCSHDADEDFVYQMIQELEENRERKLCVHERDFTPGQGIADNIVKSIGLSRRVIIIVSRKYAASAWCQYEVQIALAQLHEHRRGRLLVPVLLEDVMQDNDYAGSVKTILSLITGLRVPDQHQSEDVWNVFWDKLEATLPAKAHQNNADNVAYEVD